MKKIFLLLLTFFFIPFSAFAISLSELQSNPDKYFLIDKDLHTTSYIEPKTIYIKNFHNLTIDDQPIFFMIRIQGTAYLVNHETNMIVQYNQIFTYNCDKNVIPIIEKLHRHHSQQSDSDSRNLAYYDLEKSGGIKVNNSAGCYYHYDGSLILSSSIHYPFPLPSSPNYKMADYYFYHAFIPLFQLTLPGEP